ncbi:unnamed protein product [Orchesella dallaii]|uniref:Uncharacterized protein n=1 Tax=Orchesella dallaii TaxID=48710 RepID=A0ABP1PTN9_9HEXA
MENCIFCTSSVPSNYKKLADGKVKPRRMRSIRVSQVFSPVGPPRLSFDTQDNFLAVEGHLKTFFVLTKVLKIPHEKLSEFIGFEDGANHPELWVNVCDSCKPLVQEFYEILREVSKKTRKAGDVSDLEERLNEIYRDLKGKIFESRNKKCENYIWEQIREHVLKDDVMGKKSEVRSSVAVQNYLPPSAGSSSTTPIFQRETLPAVADVVPLNEDRKDEGQIQPGDIEPRRVLNEKFQNINNQIIAKARENIKRIKKRAAKNFNASSFSLVWKELKIGNDSDDDEEEETDESSHGGSDEEIEVTSDCEEEEDSAVDLNQPENLTIPVIVQDSKDNEGGKEDQIKASSSASQITQSVPGAAELRRSKRKIVRRMIT